MEPITASPPKRAKPGYASRMLKRITWAFVGVYGGMMGTLLWMENSLIYPAPRTAVGEWNHRDAWGAEDVTITAADGVKLHGWYIHNRYAKRVMLLCHGNGENVAMAAQEAVWLRDTYEASVLVMDYRGYGKSEGVPSEKGLYLDGEAAAQWLAKKAGVKISDLILVGRSLGSGVVVDVGVKHQVKALVLLTPFAELPDAAANMFWFVPVRLIMRNRYPSYRKIPEYQGATFIMHGDRDTLVPQWSGKKLFDAAPAPKRWVSIRGGGHNDVNLTLCERELTEFLAELDDAKPAKK